MKASVYYSQTLAGHLWENAEGDYCFEYEEAYLQEGGKAISYSIPTTNLTHTSRDIFGFFDGLLPEGWLLNLATEHWKLNPLRDRYQLLLKTAFAPIGAVSVHEKSSALKKKINHSPLGGTDEEVQLPQIGKCLYCYKALETGQYHSQCSKLIFGNSRPPVIDINKELLREMEELSIVKKLTIPGVQRKLTLDLENQKGKGQRLTLNHYGGRFILKPKGPMPHWPENEDLIMKLAKSYGIRTAQTALVFLSDGEFALISRRFDRAENDEKFHAEDFCQILDQLTLKKYVGSFEKVAKHLQKYCRGNAPKDQVLRLFELIIFSFVVGNSDLHLKNISVLLDPLPRLAPAYDLISFEIFQEDFPEKDNEQSALAINGKKNKLTKEDFDQLAQGFGIKEKVRQNVYKKLVRKQKEWSEIIDESFLPQRKQNRLKQLIADRIKIFQID